MNKKRNSAIKIGIILLALMVFFTFFSSSINYFLTPKVTITAARQGLLSRELVFNDVELFYIDHLETKLPETVPVPLFVGDVFVQKGDEIRPGDLLAIIDDAPLEDAINTAYAEMKEKEAALVMFDLMFNTEVSRIERYIEDATASLRRLGRRDAERLREDIDQHKAELDVMLEFQMVAGQSRRVVENNYDLSYRKYNDLFEVKNNIREIRADVPGHIHEINITKNQKINAGDLLFVLIPEEAMPYIKVSVSRDEAVYFNTPGFLSVEYDERDGFDIRRHTVPAEIEGITGTGAMQTVIAGFSQSISHDIHIRQAKFSLPQEVGIVIPISAVIAGSDVYTVTQINTFLGQELRVSRRNVSLGEKNHTQVIITDGLELNEFIVTSWDRPIKDGQRVLLPND